MSAIVLRRIDAEKNIARYYRIDMQPNLFGGWSFIREWGRIGRSEQVRQPPTLPRPRRLPLCSASGGRRNGAGVP
ncbi:WGR domain-containing protein [Methylosinus sp. RM1]|uniref:WGR domain-containing protein n=1 Tax=Methylosinus sp. RM1 TaxID=2583817 RepID=UPI00140E66F2